MAARIKGLKYEARKFRALQSTAIVAFLALTSTGFEARGDAILNGSFTGYSGTFGSAGGGLNTKSDYTGGGSLTNWTVADVSGSQGLAFLYFSGNQGSTTTNGVGITQNGRFGSFSMYDPGNVAGSTPSGGAIPNTSPGGGNFIAADGAVGYQVAIYQTVTGLTSGTTYALSFWYAAAQQSGFTGDTTEGWQVSLKGTAQTTQTTANGTTIQDTPAQPINPNTGQPGLANGGFQSWAQDTMYFTATSSSQVLTFLALGTPSGQPPLDLLSGVTLNVSTPEPASIALSGVGMASLMAVLWFRRNRARTATQTN